MSPNDHVTGLSEETIAGMRLVNAPPGEEICITGCAGIFPESENVYEFRDNLLNKVDMVIADHGRWDFVHPELPLRMGKINHVEKFDASFFGYHHKQAHLVDPMSRMLLEKAYEAIIDAGINPSDLHGTRTGVFIGACSSEMESEVASDLSQPSIYSMIGGSRAAFANRISYWLKVNGPSYTVDSACSSSLYAVEHGYRAIRDGLCDQAIVGGANLCLHPYVSLQFSRIGVLSPEGMCKSFDSQANGYVRSESVNMVFLQKAKDAKRVYASYVHAKTNCDGYKDQGITYPSGQMQRILLNDFYRECQVDPSSVAWVEAHGTGTEVGDPEECNAIADVMCKGRVGPLPIGSVKSNIGHTEPASGLCSITKVIIAMETGLIPPNLHYKAPRAGVPALADGTLKVVTEPLPWNGGTTAISSFGFGGANCHVLLKWNPKTKVNGGAPKDKVPRLVTLSSRTVQGLEQLMDDLESRPVDAEFVSLYHHIHSKEIKSHLYRGYTLLVPGRKIRSIKYYDEVKPRPVWLILCGMDNQWSGLAESLQIIPAFSAAIENCQQALKPTGLDLYKILAQGTAEQNCVGVTAIQIGIIDVLKTLGVCADGIIGNRVGELAAAYADNSITLTQAIIAAYYQGLALLKLEQSNIAIDSNGIPAKDDSISNLITTSEPQLLKHLQTVIPSPKLRSNAWISSSVPASLWNNRAGRLASAEYFTNSLTSKPLFREALDHIPRNAVVIELAASPGVKNVLSVNGKQKFVSLIDVKKDATENLLTQLGNLYETGVHLKLAELYPAVEYPVSRTTPMISPHIGWDHEKDWHVEHYESKPLSKSGERYVKIIVTSKDCEYYRGHVIDGRNLFPATGYLALVWDTLALMNHSSFQEVPVVFEDVRFHRATNLPKEGVVDFIVCVQKTTGFFEIVEGDSVIVTGRIFITNEVENEMVSLEFPETHNADRIELSARDIYKELNLRGYNYNGIFRSLVSAGSKGDAGKIHWQDNWVAFMDNMLQMQILGEDTRGLFVPTSIDKLCINPMKHLSMVQKMEAGGSESVFDVFVQRDVGIIKSGAIEVRGLNASAISRRKPAGEPVIEKYQFLPNSNDPPIEDAQLDVSEIMRICVQVALENTQIVEFKCIELADSEADPLKQLLVNELIQVLGDVPMIRPTIVVFSKPGNPLTEDLPASVRVESSELDSQQSCQFILGANILGRHKVLQSALVCIGNTGFIISREPADRPTMQLPGLHVLNEYTLGDERIVLVKKGNVIVDPLVIRIEESSFSWLPRLQAATRKQKSVQPVLLVAQGEQLNGVLGLFNCLRQEPGSDKARCFFIVDPHAPTFDPSLPFYEEQIAKDVAMNVYKNGRWGTYRHLRLEDNATVEAEHVFANIVTRGDLSSFQWFEGPLEANKADLSSKQNLVHVYYSALNFRDVMTATGKLAAEVVAKGRLNQECVQGLEFSGRDSAGKRVMGMISSGAMSTMVKADTELLWDIPDSWSLEDAATVPVVYGTAFYALVIIGRMAKGDTILIHAGSGGVGQAAINIALHAGCTVFTTVGTKEKREFIKERFPQLTDRHIGNSRDTSFEQLVMAETDGRGVDLVLNSLAEEKLQASIRCLAVGGRFLEIGKFDLAANNTLGMNVFLKETSFHGVMLDNLFSASSSDKKPLFDILNKGIREGAVRPLSRTVFGDDEIEQAFRFMAAGKHIGKVLLRMRSEESKSIVVPQTVFKKASSRFFCNPKSSYIIAGGLGGFGLELADWCVLRGARNLVLTSRSGVKTGYQASRIATWKSYGATIHVTTQDIATEEGVTTLLQNANKMGPVAAIFNLAVVLADAFFENQTEESFIKSARPKSDATRHLDVISRRLCPQLKHFVIFSSVSCGRGNAGQTNYGMSNSVMERICERRVNEGYPGLAVQWGVVGDVGLVADMQEVEKELVIGGTLQQRISSCLHVLDQFLRQPYPVVSSMVVAEKRGSSGGSGNIVDSVVNILGIKDLKTVSMQLTLAELGMDSMMAVEIKQTLERDFEVFLSPQEMRLLSFAKLIELSKQAAERVNEPEAESSELHTDAFQFLVRAIGDEDAVSRPFTTLPSLMPAETLLEHQSPLFMIPGIEGMSTVLEPLAKNLKSRTIGFQLGYRPEKVLERTLEMAQALLPHIKKNLTLGQHFNLFGYSFGSLVALDLAKLLEDDGYHGDVFLLDGAPDFIQGLCKSQLREGTEDNVQINLLIAITNIMRKQPASIIDSFRTELMSLPSWKERVELFITKFPETNLRPEFVANQANSTYGRIRSVLNYRWNFNDKLKSSVTLIRPTYLSMPMANDYGLSEFCEKPVDVHFVEGDHVSVLSSIQVADIINNKAATVANLA